MDGRMTSSGSVSDPPAVPDPPCVACGSVHGSINTELICLRKEVRDLRKILALYRNDKIPDRR